MTLKIPDLSLATPLRIHFHQVNGPVSVIVHHLKVVVNVVTLCIGKDIVHEYAQATVIVRVPKRAFANIFMIYVLKVKYCCTGTAHHSLICILDIKSHIRDELIIALGWSDRLGLNSSLLVNYLRCDNHPILENERSAKRLPLCEKLSHGRKL